MYKSVVIVCQWAPAVANVWVQVRCGRPWQDAAGVLEAGRALEERDREIADQRHHRTHQAVARSRDERAGPPHEQLLQVR